jgi:hypothetical protein
MLLCNARRQQNRLCKQKSLLSLLCIELNHQFMEAKIILLSLMCIELNHQFKEAKIIVVVVVRSTENYFWDAGCADLGSASDQGSMRCIDCLYVFLDSDSDNFVIGLM